MFQDTFFCKFIYPNTDQGGPTFTIDSTTGLIKVGTTLDYTAQNTYELVVIATDGASSPQSATLTATVSVQTSKLYIGSYTSGYFI